MAPKWLSLTADCELLQLCMGNQRTGFRIPYESNKQLYVCSKINDILYELGGKSGTHYLCVVIG